MSGFLILLITINLIMISYATLRFKALFHVPLLIIIPVAICVGVIVSRLVSSSNPTWMNALSAYLFAFLICAVLASAIIDLVTLINAVSFKLPFTLSVKRISYLALVFGLFGIGIYMAKMPQTAYYAINIDKPANIEKLRIVQLSDIHVNDITGRGFVEKMVERVNALDADLIVITGDILDNKLQPYLDQNLAPVFAQLKSKYGTLAVFGNHEYYGIIRNAGNTAEEVLNAFRAGKMTVLQDDSFVIPGTNIVVIGRDDYAGNLASRKRTPLYELTHGIDKNTTPIIVLDHQPFELPDAAKSGVDIMFSGHTHGGQIFPGTLMVKRMYDNPWGLYQLEGRSGHQFSSIVTSGYGLWGPPIRLLTRAEIVVTDITFKAQ